MNIAVVGTGMVGRLIAVELSRDHQVYAIDNNSENLILLNKYNRKIITNKHNVELGHTCASKIGIGYIVNNKPKKYN